ncbi:MAG: hypothetical protein HOP34_07935 [Methylococcaceae bacterium]|nr:hypothetical protein [Methylococcaceae bacterium]
MNPFYKKTIIFLLTSSLFAWNEVVIAESAMILTKVVNKASRALKNGWCYETGQIFGSGATDKIGDYVLYEQIKSPKTQSVKKPSSFTMTILFKGADQGHITLQGVHDFAEKQYSGSVTGASVDKLSLVGLQASGDDKTSQLTLTPFSQQDAENPYDPYRKLDKITIDKVKNKVATDLVYVNIKLIPSILEGFPNDIPPLGSTLLDGYTHDEWLATEKLYILSRQELNKSVEAFIFNQTTQLRDFALKQGWSIQIAHSYISGLLVGQLSVSLPVNQLPLLQDRTEVESIESDTCASFAPINYTEPSGCITNP